MLPSASPRVAYVLTQDRGGPVDVCRALVAHLHRTGAARVRVFGPVPACGTGDLAACWEETVVPGKGDVRAGRALRERVRAWAPDVVHAQDRRSGLVVAGLAGPGRRRPALLQTYHGVPDDVTEPWFRGERGAVFSPPRRLRRLPTPERPSPYTLATLAADAALARVLDRTVVPAASMGRFLRARLRVPAARIEHIPNGLELGPAVPPAGPVRHLLLVGLLVPRKGVEDLLDALARPGVLPAGARLTIAGDGPHRAAVERAAARPELVGRVEMLGFRADVPELIRAADAVVVPSRMEQQPLVVIEAMAAGKPVLATDIGDTATMLDAPGANRYLAAPGDPSSLEGALRALFADPDPARTGRLLAERATARYSAATCAAAHLDLYDRMLGRSRAGVS